MRVLLIHAGIIPHYRIPIYNYIYRYLKNYEFDFIVTSDGIEKESQCEIDFKYLEVTLSTLNIVRLICRLQIYVVIDFMELRHSYMFPTYFFAKIIMGRKMIYWGQGCDLADTGAKFKNLAYATEQALADSIILYAEHLKKYIPKQFHDKVFVANNTLCMSYNGLPPGVKRGDVLTEYGIRTKKNIISMGRIQKRKRLDHLVEAFVCMDRDDVGLIIVGPDQDGILRKYDGKNIYKLGPLYGDDKFNLLFSSDVYCLPGAVGLSIIDAFYAGLPFVTEDGDESAEIMYLKDGVNGFIVPRGAIQAMAQKLNLLVDDDELRGRFSGAARQEVAENGSIEKLCTGFRDALLFATSNVA